MKRQWLVTREIASSIDVPSRRRCDGEVIEGNGFWTHVLVHVALLGSE